MLDKYKIISSFVDYIESLAQFSDHPIASEGGLTVLNSGIRHPIFNYVCNIDARSVHLAEIINDFQNKKAPFYFCNGFVSKENQSYDSFSKLELPDPITLDGMYFDLRNPVPQMWSEDVEYMWVNSQEQLLYWLEVSAQTNGHTIEQGVQFFKTHHYIKAKLLLAMSDNQPVGGSMICLGNDRYAGNYWDSVIPQYRHRGIGSDMVKLRLEYAKTLGLQFVVAQCMDSSTRLYKKIGFENLAEIEFYVIN